MSLPDRHDSPEVFIKNLTETEIEFELRHVNTSFANALRRVIIAEVPTVAIETVEFNQNSSPIPDEMIAHRLGLIPLFSEQSDQLVMKDQCSCGGLGCPMCRVTFYLDVRTDNEPRTVTTDDLKQFDDFQAYDPNGPMADCINKSKLILPAQIPDTPNGNPTPITITRLGPHQQLSFIAYAIKGIGRDHAKWSPVCACAYHHIPRITLDQNVLKDIHGSENKMKLVQSCPSKVFRYDPNEDSIEVENASACTFCNACLEFLEEHYNGKNAIDITNEPDVFSFLVESNGMLSPQTIVSRAFQVLKEKLEKFLQEVRQAQDQTHE